MATHEIARSEWANYLKTFSDRHKGALVTIEDVEPQSSPEIESQDRPLIAITFHEDGEDGERIEVQMEGREAHKVPAPKAIYHKPGAGVLSSEVNPDEVLEITSSQQPPIHYLTFRHP